MNWIVRVSDTITFFSLFLSLTLAYKPRYSTGITAALLAGFTLAGLGSVYLQEMLPAGNFIVYIFGYVLWGWLYAAVALQEQLAFKMAMASVFVCSSFFLITLVQYAVQLFSEALARDYYRLFAVIALSASGWFLKKFSIHSQRRIPGGYYWGITVVALLSLVMYYYETMHVRRVSQEAITVLFSGHLVILYTVFWLSWALITRYENEMVQVSRQAQSQGEAELAEESIRLNQALRTQRHEMKNHLASLAALLDEKQISKARSLIADLCEAPAHGDAEVRSGNPMADAILNQKIAQARAAGIDIRVDICLDAKLPVSDKDLSSLLNNLLNNALEAARKTEQPRVSVRIAPAAGYLCFQVLNSADAALLRSNPQLTTTKENPDAHGFGLTIIRDIADKYNGKASFQTKEDTFEALVMLALTENP